MCSKKRLKVQIYWMSSIVNGGALYGIKFDTNIHWISDNVNGGAPSECNLKQKFEIFHSLKRNEKKHFKFQIYWINSIVNGGALYGRKFDTNIHSRKRCYKRRNYLISNRKCNIKLLLSVTSLSGPVRKDGTLGGNKVKKALKQWKAVNGNNKSQFKRHFFMVAPPSECNFN